LFGDHVTDSLFYARDAIQIPEECCADGAESCEDDESPRAHAGVYECRITRFPGVSGVKEQANEWADETSHAGERDVDAHVDCGEVSGCKVVVS